MAEARLAEPEGEAAAAVMVLAVAAGAPLPRMGLLPEKEARRTAVAAEADPAAVEGAAEGAAAASLGAAAVAMAAWMRARELAYLPERKDGEDGATLGEVGESAPLDCTSGHGRKGGSKHGGLLWHAWGTGVLAGGGRMHSDTRSPSQASPPRMASPEDLHAHPCMTPMHGPPREFFSPRSPHFPPDL